MNYVPIIRIILLFVFASLVLQGNPYALPPAMLVAIAFIFTLQLPNISQKSYAEYLETDNPFRSFRIINGGCEYELPNFYIKPPHGIRLSGTYTIIRLVRGATEYSEAVEGTTIETIFAMLLHDLITKNLEVPSEHTKKLILLVNQALTTIDERNKDRKERGIQLTKNQ